MRVQRASAISTRGFEESHFLPYIKMEYTVLPVKLLARLSLLS